MGLISAAYRLTASLFLFLLLCWTATTAMAEKKIIIASNGAGQDLIEHTLPAITLAATGDIDYIELHTVMTADDQLIVFRDLTLDRLTNAAELFPGRDRENGSHYVIDFSLHEIRQMRLHNGADTDTPWLSLPVPTLKEALGMIRRLESILAKPIGVSLEIRAPRFHSEAGKDISSATLDILKDNSYIDRNSKIFIQCFDPDELQRIYSQLMPEKGIHLPLIQLTGSSVSEQEPSNMMHSHDWLFSNSGLKIISSYAAAVGLPAEMVIGKDGSLLLTDYLAASHKYGLSVFVYSLSNRPEKLPPFADSFRTLIDLYLQKADIDGFYTDAFSEAATIITNAEADDQKGTIELSGPPTSLDTLSPADQGPIGDSHAKREETPL